jgi:hypothetical protein
MAYLFSQWTPNVQNKYFMFDLSIFTIFVLNRCWRRDSIQIKLFVYVCSIWNVDELKTRFETWITRNDVNGVRLFHFFYLIIVMAYVRSQRTQNFQISYMSKLYVWLVYFHSICAKQRLETWLTPNKDIRICLFDMSHIWTKNAFWDVNNRKWRKSCVIVSPLLFKIAYV